jgi:hypothetical protein
VYVQISLNANAIEPHKREFLVFNRVLKQATCCSAGVGTLIRKNVPLKPLTINNATVKEGWEPGGVVAKHSGLWSH